MSGLGFIVAHRLQELGGQRVAGMSSLRLLGRRLSQQAQESFSLGNFEAALAPRNWLLPSARGLATGSDDKDGEPVPSAGLSAFTYSQRTSATFFEPRKLSQV